MVCFTHSSQYFFIPSCPNKSLFCCHGVKSRVFTFNGSWRILLFTILIYVVPNVEAIYDLFDVPPHSIIRRRQRKWLLSSFQAIKMTHVIVAGFARVQKHSHLQDGTFSSTAAHEQTITVHSTNDTLSPNTSNQRPKKQKQSYHA